MSTRATPPANAAWHGTLNGYTNRACRCEECRHAWTSYARRYRARRLTAARHALSRDVDA
jgi:hypothetical protein